MQITSLAAQPPLIQLEAVRKAFRAPDGQRFEAVRETTLAIERGDVFGLVGKSGAGKSTLLRLINLLERPDAGRVRVAGRDLTALGKSELRDARQGIGMIFQQFNLLQNASVFDNVAFPLKIHGRHSKLAIAARVDECLALVGLQEKAASHPAQLSGGQKQRVAIARALVKKPAVVLADEPTANLDSRTGAEVIALMRSIQEDTGASFVFSTHDPQLISHADETFVIRDGELAEHRVERAS
jgi:D-methionine transport system ATP-binding protein